MSFAAQARQSHAVNGYVTDAATGEGLIGVTVVVREINKGTTTNPYGYYSLTLPEGEYTLSLSYIGYEEREERLSLTANTTLNVSLSEQTTELEEVVISDTPVDENVQSTEMGVNKVDMKTISRMPALLGEVDIVRSIQLLPGISSVGEGASGFNVRGGGVDQNLVLLDEAPVYNSSHLFGLFSVFNPDAVKDVELIKGGIPAIYGGRLSSILDVRMKEGNSRKFSGNGGIGTVSSRLTLEGPIIKDKASFIVAGRRSYADLLLKFTGDEELSNNTLYFYDLSAKGNYRIDEKNTVFLSGYFGRDVSKFSDEFAFDWGNATGTVRWNHLFNERWFANFTVAYSDYVYSLGIPEGSQAFDWEAAIINYNAKADFNYYIQPGNTFNFGVNAIHYKFNPGIIRPISDNSIFNTLELDSQYALETAAYADHEWEVSDRISLRYGLRLSHFRYLGPQTVYDYTGETGEHKEPVNPRTFDSGETIADYTNLEPRFSMRYALDRSSSVKISYNRMAQYIHLISSSTAASPLDIWSPSTLNIKPGIAHQVAGGYFRNLMDNTIETSAEVFYKTLENQVDYIDGADLLLNEFLEGDLLYGRGRAYGLELFVRKKEGDLTGWVSYTLSRSERQVDGISNSEWYPAKYDRTHVLNIVSQYDLNDRWNFSANFAYATGVATTFPNARFVWNGITAPHNTEELRNNYRVPAYHRLDVSATLQGRKTEKFQHEWVFSIYNVYARRNPFTIYFQQNEDMPQNTEAVRLSIFGTILPSVTFNFKF